MSKKVQLMEQWTKSTDQLKNESLNIALEELSNNADEFISGKKSTLNRAKTALKSVQMNASKSGNFESIYDAELRVEIAQAEFDKAKQIAGKYFDSED